jgi:hypothetical protein
MAHKKQMAENEQYKEIKRKISLRLPLIPGIQDRYLHIQVRHIGAVQTFIAS